MCGRARCTLNPNQVAAAAARNSVRTVDTNRYFHLFFLPTSPNPPFCMLLLQSIYNMTQVCDAQWALKVIMPLKLQFVFVKCSFRPSYNVSPGMYVPVALLRRISTGVEGEKEVQPVVHCMKWGLVPSFTNKNEKPDHYRMVGW